MFGEPRVNTRLVEHVLAEQRPHHIILTIIQPIPSVYSEHEVLLAHGTCIVVYGRIEGTNGKHLHLCRGHADPGTKEGTEMKAVVVQAPEMSARGVCVRMG